MDAASIERSLRAIPGVVGCSVSGDGVVLLLAEDADRRAVGAEAERVADLHALSVRLLVPPAAAAALVPRSLWRRAVPAGAVAAGVASVALVAAFLPISSRVVAPQGSRPLRSPPGPLPATDVVAQPPARRPVVIVPRKDPADIGRAPRTQGTTRVAPPRAVRPPAPVKPPRVVPPPPPPPPPPVVEDACVWPGRHAGWERNGSDQQERHANLQHCPPATGWRARNAEQVGR